MKYHYSYRRFTYPMMGRRHLPIYWSDPSGSFRFSDSSDKTSIS